jgi:predicted O-methyltransferase YrrM
MRVEAVLAEVAAFGRDNDARETDYARRMLNITPETGALLRILAIAIGARRILEVGTSDGYSTLWLAWAAQATGGHVETIERSADKIALARANLDRAGLAQLVTIHEGVALDIIDTLDGPFDLVFLDADRPNYLAYAERLLALLRPRGLLVTDNVVSHATELVAFLERIKADPRCQSVTLPLGNGEELTLRQA